MTFSPDGSELLANCGGEQIYLFDVNQPRAIEHFRPPQSENIPSNLFAHHRPFIPDFAHFADNLSLKSTENSINLSNLIKERANQYYSEQKFPLSIQCYNQALSINSLSSVLWANRAAALIKRNWCGDVYQAVRDCQRAIDIDFNYFKAYCRLARCLYDLNWPVDSLRVLDFMRQHFPEQQMEAIDSFYNQVVCSFFVNYLSLVLEIFF